MSDLEQEQNLPEETAAAPAAEPPPATEPAPAPEPAAQEPAPQPVATPTEAPAGKQAPKQAGRGPDRREKPGGRPERGGERGGERGERPDRGTDRGRPNDRGERRGPREQGRPGERDRARGLEAMTEIDIDKLISDSLYLDNQAHAVVSRMRDMDSGTRSQLRRLFSAVRRACRAAEPERQHQFVMLRARLAYTIARHQLRSLDPLERLLLQVTRKNDARGYERFRDLFEAIVAYNE